MNRQQTYLFSELSISSSQHLLVGGTGLVCSCGGTISTITTTSIITPFGV